MYNIISSGSKGNAVIYFGCILLDCGVNFKALKPYVNDINIVLLTHKHLDHINIKTLKSFQFERPTLRIGCCEWMLPVLEGFKNIDIYEIGELYDYGFFKLSPIKLYHDVKNCGYRLFKDKVKLIHATDTAHLNGISAKEYDLYAIEHNYNEETINETIERKQLRGEFSHEKGAVNSHLSEQQAQQFFFENKGDNSKIIRLHESSILKL